MTELTDAEEEYLIKYASKKSEETTHPRWTPFASLQETMESRTHLGRVGQFSTTGRAMGISHPNVSSLCQSRLSDDRP